MFYIVIFDNGVEFRDVSGIEMSCLIGGVRRTKIYFAHPYKSNDRAINENNNRMIRKYVSKSSDISKYSNEQI
jgi:IS30 family transposase